MLRLLKYFSFTVNSLLLKSIVPVLQFPCTRKKLGGSYWQLFLHWHFFPLRWFTISPHLKKKIYFALTWIGLFLRLYFLWIIHRAVCKYINNSTMKLKAMASTNMIIFSLNSFFTYILLLSFRWANFLPPSMTLHIFARASLCLAV